MDIHSYVLVSPWISTQRFPSRPSIGVLSGGPDIVLSGSPIGALIGILSIVLSGALVGGAPSGSPSGALSGALSGVPSGSQSGAPSIALSGARVVPWLLPRSVS